MARQAVNYGDRPRGRCRAWPAASSRRRASSCRRASSATRRASARTATSTQPDLAKAKQLVQQSGHGRREGHGLGPEAQPAQASSSTYYTDLLNKIGFKATPKIIADDDVLPDDRQPKTNPQTGFADWIQDFPNPSDFYLLLDANTHPADQQPELQQGQRSAHPERAERAQPGAGDEARHASPTSGRRSTSTRPRRPTSPSTAHEQVPQFYRDRRSTSARPCSTRCTATTGRPSQLK